MPSNVAHQATLHSLDFDGSTATFNLSRSSIAPSSSPSLQYRPTCTKGSTLNSIEGYALLKTRKEQSRYQVERRLGSASTLSEQDRRYDESHSRKGANGGCFSVPLLWSSQSFSAEGPVVLSRTTHQRVACHTINNRREGFLRHQCSNLPCI